MPARALPRVAEASPAGADGSFALADLAPDNWSHLLDVLGLGGIIHNIASHCELRSRENSALSFVLDQDNGTLFNDSHTNKLQLALENYFGEPLSVRIETGVLERESPAMRSERLAAERQQQAIQSIEEDSQLQALITRFDGELDRGSIAPTDV